MLGFEKIGRAGSGYEVVLPIRGMTSLSIRNDIMHLNPGMLPGLGILLGMFLCLIL